ncbi:O-antigen ligase family protein [Sporolactobacillus pectinivorans]|uniref:O-antigen ligase family protein n=1 Tax=Sporolactobacillus pectinivorans TaxID=1591408 RepID=UPI000C260653|nr:O-antigen ligase family protein [Sporolactobacillus pectinivorans]
MSVFLMPITLLIKHYLPFSYMYLAEVDLYLFMILVVLYSVSRNGAYFKSFSGIKTITTNYFKTLFSKKVFIFILCAFCIQILSIILSYLRIGKSIYNVNPIVGFAAVTALTCVFFLHYIVVGVLVSNKDDILQFIRGTYWTTVSVLIIVYIQLMFLVVPPLLGPIVHFFGIFFEQKNGYMLQWYWKGSYVQTLGRINGFFSEPAKLAAFLCIICLPFILAAIKNKYSIFNPKLKYQPIKYYSLLLIILIALLYAKTTTGIFAIVLAIGVFWLTLSRKRKISFGIAIMIGLIALVILYFTNGTIHRLASEYIFGKAGGTSSDNRLGGTIALFVTFLHHPILGVGQSYTDFFLLKGTPAWTTHNAEFASFVKVRHAFPIYSNLLGWLVQYGLIICSFFAIYIISMKRSMSRLVDRLKGHPDHILYQTINDAAFYFLIFFFALSAVTFGWNESAFFIMLFFFVVFRQYLKKIAIGTIAH